jgi:hypothetical protein
MCELTTFIHHDIIVAVHRVSNPIRHFAVPEKQKTAYEAIPVRTKIHMTLCSIAQLCVLNVDIFVCLVY